MVPGRFSVGFDIPGLFAPAAVPGFCGFTVLSGEDGEGVEVAGGLTEPPGWEGFGFSGLGAAFCAHFAYTVNPCLE